MTDRGSLVMNDDRVVEYLRTQHAIKLWIGDVLGVPLVGEDLRFGLKNGVILCYLMQEIEPESVPNIHENTTQVFKLKENVENFIAAVSEYGVPRHKLFAVNDLFEGANMPRVIECLAWLGKVAEDHEFHTPLSEVIAEAQDYQPTLPTGDELFKLKNQLIQVKEPPRGRKIVNSDNVKRKTGVPETNTSTPTKPVTPSHATTPVTPAYPTTPTAHATPTTPVVPATPTTPTTPSTPAVVVSTPTHVQTKEPEPIPVIKEPKHEPPASVVAHVAELNKASAGFTKFQAAYRCWRQKKLYKEKRRHAAFRDKVAKELLKTEQDYVQSLDACIKYYHKPLHDAVMKSKDSKLQLSKDSLSRDQLRSIFSDIHIIWEFNSTLLADISARVEKWYPNQKIGDIFLRMAAVLKIYSNYVQNFDSALRVLDEVKKKDKKISNFLQETRNVPQVKNLDLASFLIMPVQRIPRYYLLLQELLKHTWKDHPDHISLTEATAKVKDVAAYINEKKREAESQAKVSEIHSVLRGKYQPLYAAGRRLVREAVFPDVKDGDKYVYLFSDILVWGKANRTLLKGSSSFIKYKDTLPLDSITVTDAGGANFTIKSSKTKHALTLHARDEDDKLSWIDDIDRTTKDIGKVKLIGAPEQERRKPSKTLLNSKSTSRLMRHSTTIPMRNIPGSPPLSPLVVNGGVMSAPTTPQNASGVPSSPPASPTSPPVSPPVSPSGPMPTSFSTPTPRSGAPTLATTPSTPTTPAAATPTPTPVTPTVKTTPTPTPVTPTTTATPTPTPTSPTVKTTPQQPNLTPQPQPIPTTPTTPSTPSTPFSPANATPTATTPNNAHSDQLAKLLETKEAILKQLKNLDLQPLEKKMPPQQPEPKEDKEEKPEEGVENADRPNKRKPKRDVGTIRKMNEHQFRETVRAQLESELEAVETQIAVAQGTERPQQQHGTLRRLTPPRDAPASAGSTPTHTTHGTLRRLTPPREAPASTEAPATRVSLQPARPVVKREDSLPEALKALQKIKNASRESTLIDDSPSSPAAPEDHKANMRDLRASTSYLHTPPQSLSSSPTSQPGPAAPPSNAPSSFSGPPSEKDDVLGYGKMTHGGIRKHVAMLDRTKLEAYLSDEEFSRVFSMNRTEFNALPKWKQERSKRERGLL